jgi:hypothetical protein
MTVWWYRGMAVNCAWSRRLGVLVLKRQLRCLRPVALSKPCARDAGQRRLRPAESPLGHRAHSRLGRPQRSRHPG